MLDFPMRVLNLSAGGFLMDVPLELPRGTVERCKFLTDRGDEIRLRARVVHVLVRRLVTDTSYLIGFEFVDTRSAAVQHAIARLLGTAPDSQSNAQL
jgi:hypothetical protein